MGKHLVIAALIALPASVHAQAAPTDAREAQALAHSVEQLRSSIGRWAVESKGAIEMVSVGADGQLWIMSGPLGGEERLSQEYQAGPGVTARLRFTRFNVAANSFESRMEYTEDGGRTWKQGNHQTFRRATEAGTAGAVRG